MKPSNPALKLRQNNVPQRNNSPMGYQTAKEIKSNLSLVANSSDIEILQRFFKTGPGEYGEGDKFIGVRVPQIRTLAKKCLDTPISAIKSLLHSSIHEERLTALIIMCNQFSKGSHDKKRLLYETYLANTNRINNWDLVDLSAPTIVGGWLSDKPRKILYDLARSSVLWERRISIVSTYHFIRSRDFSDAMKIARLLLKDKEDLIHKASGWMLREVGKREVTMLRKFLDSHAKEMPRTMLRYSIERLSLSERKKYMDK